MLSLHREYDSERDDHRRQDRDGYRPLRPPPCFRGLPGQFLDHHLQPPLHLHLVRAGRDARIPGYKLLVAEARKSLHAAHVRRLDVAPELLVVLAWFAWSRDRIVTFRILWLRWHDSRADPEVKCRRLTGRPRGYVQLPCPG